MRTSKSLAVLMTLVLTGLALVSAPAYGYQFPSGQVQPYYLTGPATGQAGYYGVIGGNPNWYAVIGGAGIFGIAGADFSGTTLTLFSNWNGPSGYDLGAVTADLFLSSNPANGTWDFAVGLRDTDLNIIYKNPTFNTSQTLFGGNGGVVYGGRWDNQGTPTPVPVQATSGAVSNPASVIWTTISSSDAKYQVAVDLSALTQYGFDPQKFEFLWASATCANGVIEGKVEVGPDIVPAPGTLLLLGSGLAGLGIWRRRGIFKS